jgi:16S rRNA processing protein RimM
MSKPTYLSIGKLHRSFGLNGEMLMEVITDFPERIKKGVIVYLGEQYLPAKIHSCRHHAQGLLVSFEGYSTSDSIISFRNNWVFVTAEDRPKLPEGQYYHHDLIGMQVFTNEGLYLGELSEILETGANDVYIIIPETGKEILIPATADFVVKIDLEMNKITIKLMPGIISDTPGE